MLLTAGPEQTGSALNGIEYALSLSDYGHDVRIYLDGPATKWAAEIKTRNNHPVCMKLQESLDKQLVAGACAYCAHVFDHHENCRALGIELCGTEDDDHGPDVSQLVAEGFNLLPIN